MRATLIMQLNCPQTLSTLFFGEGKKSLKLQPQWLEQVVLSGRLGDWWGLGPIRGIPET